MIRLCKMFGCLPDRLYEQDEYLWDMVDLVSRYGEV